MARRLAILGCGTMGETILAGSLQAGSFVAADIIATVRRPEQGRAIATRHSVEVTTDNAAACERADVVVVSVKPQYMSELLDDDPDPSNSSRPCRADSPRRCCRTPRVSR